MKQRPACPHCGGHNVLAEAYCVWDVDEQRWIPAELTDAYFCTTCEDTIKYVEMVEMVPLKIDWALLRHQKQYLRAMTYDEDRLTEEIEVLAGVVNLIDHIQDEAVVTRTATELEVFGEDA